MKRTYEQTLESLASDIEALVGDLRFNTGLQILYAGSLMDKYIDIIARRYGQNRSRVDILNALVIHGGIMKPSDLSKTTFRSKQAVTRITDGLERDGLVKRELVSKDRRTRKVIITAKGLDSASKFISATQKTRNPAVAKLSHEQLQVLNTLLRQVRKELLRQIAFVRKGGRL